MANGPRFATQQRIQAYVIIFKVHHTQTYPHCSHASVGNVWWGRDVVTIGLRLNYRHNKHVACVAQPASHRWSHAQSSVGPAGCNFVASVDRTEPGQAIAFRFDLPAIEDCCIPCPTSFTSARARGSLVVIRYRQGLRSCSAWETRSAEMRLNRRLLVTTISWTCEHVEGNRNP